mgnify:CR=1 FL=1
MHYEFEGINFGEGGYGGVCFRNFTVPVLVGDLCKGSWVGEEF